MLTKPEQILLIAMIFVIMFGLGCTLSIKDFKQALRNPFPAIIGFLSQYLIMPALAFGMARFFELPAPVAIGLIIVACCPSGTTSSLFNYFAKGDLALSISLSTITTAAALAAMPTLLAIYAGPYTAEEFVAADGSTTRIQIDQGKVIGSLLVCLVPVAMGMFLRHRSERWAKNMEETGSALGIGVIIFLIVTWLPRNFSKMLETDYGIYVTSVFLGLGGFAFGYLVSRLVGMSKRKSRTVALETGIQNGPLAFAIIILSFPENTRDTILWPALLYSLFIVFSSTIVTYFMRVFTRQEWSAHENATVQAQLFTKNWLKP